jgi:acyl phosphate:glycerol-3-phosphate acyltransferase
MTPLVPTILAALGGYLAGSMPFGYWVVRLLKRTDIRAVGSGNIGATNVWRTYGWRYGAPVVLLDVAKGFVPAFLGVHFVSNVAGVVAGAAAMIGHWRPVFLKFERGGKMVATCGGAFFGLAPLAALGAGLVWLAFFLLFRYASVASLAAAVSLPLLAWATGKPASVIEFAAAAGVAVFFLHRQNIRRLREGTESRFELRRRSGSGARSTARRNEAPAR